MTGPPDQAGATGKGDEFVEGLGNRLSQEHQLPPEDMSSPAQDTEASDVHKLPAGAFPDDAIDVPPPPSTQDANDAFADFEDDMEGEATRIEDSHLLAEQSTSILEAPSAQPFLAVERGKDMGRDFVLQEGENGVGRGIDNDVILADVAVSRRHLKIFREGDTLRFKDLGSGNGTLLNGRKISTAILVDGDRIELGETTLVVRLPGAPLPADDPYDSIGEPTDESNIGSVAPPPHPSATPSDPFAIPHGPGYQPELTPSNTAAPNVPPATQPGAVTLPKPLLIAGAAGAAFLFLLLVITIGVLVIGGGSDEPEEATVTVGSSHFDQGVRAYNDQQWAEAQSEFTIALEENSSDSRVQSYITRTRIAAADQGTLDRARRLRGEGDLEGAFNAASSVTNADSPLLDTARTLQSEIRTQQAGLAVGDGQRALAAGNLEEATRQLELARHMNAQASVVRSLEEAIAAAGGATPAPAEAPPVVEEAPEEPAETQPAETQPAETQAAEPAQPAVASSRRGSTRRSGSTRRGSGSTRSSGRRGATMPTNVTGRRGSRRGSSSSGIAGRVIQTYVGGNFTGAANMARIGAEAASGAEASRLRTMQTNITSFGRLWGQITGARFGAGVRRQMSSAMALDRQISPSNSHYRDQLSGHLVRLHLADATRQRGDVVASCRSVQAAYRIAATNADVRRRSSECEAMAGGMLRGAASQPRAQQAQVYGRVLQMVPGSSQIARDARSRAQALRRSTQTHDDDE